MDKERVRRYLIDFQEREFTTIEREVVLKESTKIQTVIGARRVGKTYLFFHTINQLVNSGVAKKRIIYLNFESPVFTEISYKEIAEVLEIQWSLFPEIMHQKLYLFIDEPQVISRWELAVRDIYDRYKCQIFLTGSSSKLLSKEIATSLRGRSITTLLLPLSFEEYLNFKEFSFDKGKIGSVVQASLQNYLTEYLEYGGYPEIVLEKDVNEKLRIIKDYFDLVVYRDIIERYGIRNTNVIRWLMNTFLSSVAKEVSLHNLYNTLRSRGIRCSKNTLYSYFSILEDSLFIFPLRRFVHSAKESGLTLPKIYVDDVGFLNLFSVEEYGRRLENIVYLQLLRQKNKNPLLDYYYWKTQDSKEVDFVVTKGKKVVSLLQVCTALSNDKIRTREFSSLLAALDYFKLSEGVLLTKDDHYRQEKIQGKIITIMPVWRWILRAGI